MRKHLLRLDCILPLNYPRYDFDKPRLGFYQRPKPILEMHVGIFRMQHLGPKLRDNQILQDFEKSFGDLGLGVVQLHASSICSACFSISSLRLIQSVPKYRNVDSER